MKDPNHASEFHERLVKWINDYNDNLDSAHEVGVQLVNFGQNVTIRLEDIGYWNPSLMSFSGVREDTHEPVELIQHVTQISILLTSLSRTNPLEPKKRIGFEAPETDPQALENV